MNWYQARLIKAVCQVRQPTVVEVSGVTAMQSSIARRCSAGVGVGWRVRVRVYEL